MTKSSALVIGATGITGYNTATALVKDGWTVYGLSRSPAVRIPGVTHLYADILDSESLKVALAGVEISHVFFATWSRQATEAANCEVNGAMLGNVLEVVGSAGNLEHVALVTGLKHYLGPFEAYATTPVETPFRESQARMPTQNFYYDQEDLLFAAAERYGFSWSVHRASTIIGWAIGNAMNMGVTLAVYASICQATKRPFVFPGSPNQWDGIVDVVDARLLGDHLRWAATAPMAKNQAFNVSNGDVFRWRQMWPKVAANFDLEVPEYKGYPTPLVDQMVDANAEWRSIVEANKLVNYEATHLASWWHSDADLGRQLETFADMSKSRECGFLEYQSSEKSFSDLFAQLREARIIP